MLKVTQIEYDIDGKVWNATVCCTSDQDALRFLTKLSKKKIKVNNLGFDKEIHGFTDDALDYIYKKTNMKNKVETNQEEASEEQPVMYTCPWCDKSYDKASSLKSHMNKSHNVKVVEEKE